MSFSSDAAAFITGVSQQTGIDPRVLSAWVTVEGAYASNGTGGHNYLNLRPYQGDPYSSVSSGGFEQFSSVDDAIAATVRRIRQPFARPILQGVAMKATPAQEIQLISATGWDAGHYAGGSSLVRAFSSLFSAAALNDRYQGPDTASAVASTVGTGSAADAGSSTSIGGAVKHVPGVQQAVDAANSVNNIGDFLGKISSVDFLLRAGEVVGGAALIILGVYLLARQVGLAPSIPSPVRAATSAVG